MRKPTLAQDGIWITNFRGTQLRIGASWLVLNMALLGGAWWLRTRPADGDLPGLALLLMLAAAVGCTLQSGLHWWIARRQSSTPRALVLTAVGYRAEPDVWGLGRGEAARWLARNAGPLATLGGLTTAVWIAEQWLPGGGQRLPGGGSGASAAEPLVGALSTSEPWTVLRWCWVTQIMLMLCPIPGTIGRGFLVACVALARKSPDPRSALRGADAIQGLFAVLLIVASVWFWGREGEPYPIPAWPFLALLGVLVWATRGSAPDLEPPSPSAKSLSPWVRWRMRRTRRSEIDEAVDAERVDAILDKLHRDGFASLGSRERAILRRVSERLRQQRWRRGNP